MSKYLVTGANGFVGSHLVAELLRGGHDVACLVRKTSNLRYIEKLGVETVFGELRDPASLAKAVSGRDVVVHNAAITRAFYPREHFRINAGGTLAVLRACVAADGPHKFVLVSSQAAAGPAPSAEPINEDAIPCPVSAYGRSKLLAEKIAAKFGEHFADRLAVTIVRPTAVYGPRDTDMFATFKAAAAHVATVVGLGRSKISITHVADIARGIALAAQSDAANGRTYFLAAERAYTCDEIAEAVAQAVGTRAVKLRLSGEAVRSLARTITGLTRVGRVLGLCHRPPLMTIERGIELSQPFWVCDPGRAMRELGFCPRYDIETGFRETVKWYRENGWL